MTVPAQQAQHAQQVRETAELQHSYLESLAPRLARLGLTARLQAPAGRIPSLHVVNPAATVLAENVVAACGRDGTWWYWWSWAERIAPAGDPDVAAGHIARVLSAPNG